MIRQARLLLLAVGMTLLVAVAGRGQEVGSRRPRVEPYGDFRLRLEQDWDSREGDGSQRDDRLRLRFRLRLGLDFQAGERWKGRIQMRSGPHDSQQSPHITIFEFDGGANGPFQFNLDYWYVSYESDRLEVWAGRN